jgi:hypothetical protein
VELLYLMIKNCHVAVDGLKHVQVAYEKFIQNFSWKTQRWKLVQTSRHSIVDSATFKVKQGSRVCAGVIWFRIGSSG